jgi:hypothetical protein
MPANVNVGQAHTEPHYRAADLCGVPMCFGFLVIFRHSPADVARHIAC